MVTFSATSDGKVGAPLPTHDRVYIGGTKNVLKRFAQISLVAVESTVQYTHPEISILCC